MSITYTTNKLLEVPGIGTETNAWGTPLNNDWDYIDKSFGGTTTLNATGLNGTVNLTITQYRPPNIIITGNPTGNLLYSIPAGVGGVWTIYNNTGNPYNVAFGSAGGGTYVVLQQGARTQVVSDGTNIQVADTYTIPISRGGTAATTAATAINNLLPSQTGSGGLFLTTDGTNVSWAAASGGGGSGVTSISTAGSVNGLTLSGGPITSTGTITLGGTLTGISLTSQVGGVLPVTNGGTGLSTTPSNGQIDIGNGSGFTRTTLTAGSGITITNGTGSITIAATGGGGGSVSSVTASSPLASSGGTTPNISLTGTVPTGNGGTGLTSFSYGGGVGGIMYAAGSSTLSTNYSLLGFDGTYLRTAYDAFFGPVRIGIGPGFNTSNTILGRNAFGSNTSGYNNVSVGWNSLYYNSNGYENTAVGVSALGYNSSGGENTAVGYNSLASASTGYYNTGVGSSSLYSVTTGTDNTGMGWGTLDSLTTGSGNTALGDTAGRGVATGSFNIAIGYLSLNSYAGSASGNIAIGGVTSSGSISPYHVISSSDNDVIALGSTATSAAYVKTPWTTTSDIRDKTNFGTVPHGLDFVTKLTTISYQYKYSREDDTPVGLTRYGFKAQEILALEGDNSVIVDSRDAEKLKFNSDSLVPVLVNAIKELKAELDALKAEIATLKGA